MKLTRHNGRSGKNETYNPKHNDRRFDIANSDHIDEERAKQNVYWDCYQGFHFPKDQDQEDKVVYSFEQIEKVFYSERYDDFCEAQHERNKKTGHSNRDRSTEDLWKDKKTCPEESLIQIGTMEQSVSPAVLARIAAEFFEEFERRFGEHIHILDWSLHLDESTPHIHERHVFDCENRYGEIAPQQEKALEALGFDLPDPDQRPGKLNNRKMTFDAACRAMLFDICKRHDLHLDEEPEYGGRAYLEKQDYILMKQKEMLEEQEETIEEQDAIISKKSDRLDELTMKITDAEELVDEVADAAYEKAVETIAETVQTETHKEDIRVLADYQKWLLSPERKAPKEIREYAAGHIDKVIRKIQSSVKKVKDRILSLLRDPEKKKKVLQPVKERARQSVLEQLKALKADSGMTGSTKKKQAEKAQDRGL